MEEVWCRQHSMSFLKILTVPAKLSSFILTLKRLPLFWCKSDTDRIHHMLLIIPSLLKRGILNWNASSDLIIFVIVRESKADINLTRFKKALIKKTVLFCRHFHRNNHEFNLCTLSIWRQLLTMSKSSKLIELIFY